jgi:histone acetyltransferase (RNA polymerase elongator complex component)
VAFYGGNFLGLPSSYRDPLLKAVLPFIASGDVEGIRFSTRPDSVSANGLEWLKRWPVSVVEVGAQSMDNTILGNIQRGHQARDTEVAVERLKNAGVRVGIQLMPGLPGDSVPIMMESGRRVVRLKPEFVRIYPAVVVRGTALEDWYRDGRYVPLTLRDAVEITKRLFRLFSENGISVVRMGLHAADSLLAANRVVAGPFHPAFGHLVHQALFLDRAVAVLEQQSTLRENVTLKVHPRHLSRLQGDRGQNLEHLRSRFPVERVTIIADTSVPLGEVVFQET